MVDRDNVIRVKTYAFAIRVVNAYRFLCNSQQKYVLSKQMLRSGTAIGALVAEAHHAQSKADFLNKMNIGCVSVMLSGAQRSRNISRRTQSSWAVHVVRFFGYALRASLRMTDASFSIIV